MNPASPDLEKAPSASPPQTGLLLVGHGTRDEAGQREFLELAAEVGRQCQAGEPMLVEACFLELAQPTIEVAVHRLVWPAKRRAGDGTPAGLREIIVAPLLLFAAGHAKRDIPEAVEAALGGNAQIAFRQLPPFGCDSRLIELSAARFRESLVGREAVPAGETALVLVGRGSSDDEATAAMFEFARLRAGVTPVGECATCFFAMTQPPLRETLSRVAQTAARRIVVQPHLLFRGELLARLTEEVEEAAKLSAVAGSSANESPKEWIIAQHLGPDPRLAALVVRMARENIEPWQTNQT